MKELALKTPVKDARKIEKLEFALLDDARRDESPDTVDSNPEATAYPEDAELEELRKHFVGDVDITEGWFHLPTIIATRL